MLQLIILYRLVITFHHTLFCSLCILYSFCIDLLYHVRMYVLII